MCDYSLMNVPNRLAQEGEELVAHRFPTGSLGLASPCDLRRIADAPAPARRNFWNAAQRPFRRSRLCRLSPNPALCARAYRLLHLLDALKTI